MSVRFAKIHRVAEEKYEELLATGQTLEILESQLKRELKTYANMRGNPAQICKSILGRVREARTVERAAATNLVPTPKSLLSPPSKARAKSNVAPTKMVVLKIQNGYFNPTQSAGPGKMVWEIKKRDRDEYHTPAVEVPAAISQTTLEYIGTNLTPDQLRYNSLARRVNTMSIIASRIKRGMEQFDEGLAEATMRAHSWAECEVAMLAGRLAEEERERNRWLDSSNKKKEVDTE